MAGEYGYSAGTLAEDEIHTFFEKGCEIRIAPVAGTLTLEALNPVTVSFDTSLTDGLYFRLFTPEEAIDMTPGEMGDINEGKVKQERTMVKFPDGDISFLLSIPPMQSYKPLEQLGPSAQPDNIRIKS